MLDRVEVRGVVLIVGVGLEGVLTLTLGVLILGLGVLILGLFTLIVLLVLLLLNEGVVSQDEYNKAKGIKDESISKV